MQNETLIWQTTDNTLSTNETYDDPDNYISHQLPAEVRWAGIIVGSIAISIGTIGNLLTIIAIRRNRQMHTTFNVFIANLCLIDLLTASTMLPLNVTSYALGYWPFQWLPYSCSIQAFYYYCCGYTSIVCLMAISVNRLIGITMPTYYEKVFSKRKVKFGIIFTWLFAPALLMPFFFNNGFSWVEKYSLCVFDVGHFTKPWLLYMLFVRVIFQMVPIFFFIIIYAIIFFQVRGSGIQVIKMSLKSNSGQSTRYSNSDESTTREDEELVRKYSEKINRQTSGQPKKKRFLHKSRSNLPEMKKPLSPQNALRVVVSAPGGDVRSNQKPKYKVNSPFNTEKYFHRPIYGIRRGTCGDLNSTGSEGINKMISNRQNVDYKLLGISVTIVFVFTVLFLPSVIVNLLPNSHKFDRRIHALCSLVTWFNSMVNPIIYCFLNKRFRDEYRKILRL